MIQTPTAAGWALHYPRELHYLDLDVFVRSANVHTTHLRAQMLTSLTSSSL